MVMDVKGGEKERKTGAKVDRVSKMQDLAEKELSDKEAPDRAVGGD